MNGEILKEAYKKFNIHPKGSFPLGGYTKDELKALLLTEDGIGREAKSKILDGLIDIEIFEAITPYLEEEYY